MSARIAGEGIADGTGASDLAKIARTALRQATATMNPSVVFAFVSSGKPRGSVHEDLLKVAHEARVLAPECAVLVAATPGVMGGGVEREGRAAVSALAFDTSVVRARLSVLSLGMPRAAHERYVFEATGAVPEGGRATRLAVALLAPDTHTTEALTGFARRAEPPVVGAGTSLVVGGYPGRDAVPCAAAVVTLSTSLGVSIVASPAARVITPWMRVEESDGPFILRAGARRMLDIVNEHVEHEALLIAVKGHGDAPPLLRAISGADPARGAVAIGESVAPDACIAIAVRDPAAARADLSARLANLARGGQGSTPAAGLVFTCAGRGSRFFGRPDVDAGIVRSKFAALPMAGMQSGFELAPWGAATRVHLYTAVCAVFHRPS